MEEEIPLSLISLTLNWNKNTCLLLRGLSIYSINIINVCHMVGAQ